MAVATGTYIAVDKLKATLNSTTSNSVSELYATGSTTSVSEVRRMYLNDASGNLSLVWDVWDTVLSAFNFDMPASGGYVEDYIDAYSYGTDIEGIETDLDDISFSPSWIDENLDESEQTYTVKVTQGKTGKSVTVYCTQAEVEIEISSYLVVSGTPDATGYWASVEVHWTEYRNGEFYDEGDVTPTSISGSAKVDGAYIDGSDVWIPNAGTYTDQRTAFTITSYKFKKDGVTYTESANKTIKLAPNSVSTETEYDVYYDSLSDDTLSAAVSTFTFKAYSRKRTITSYDSGVTSTGSWSNTVGGKLAKNTQSSIKTISPTSFTGSATITVTLNENIGSERYPSVKLTSSSDSSKYVYVEVTQEEVFYEFTSNTLAPSVEAEGGEINVTLISRRNGNPLAVTTSNISVSGATGTSKSVTHLGDGEYSIVVTVPENTTGSQRTITIKAFNPDNNTPYTWTAVQAAASVEVKDKVRTVGTAEFTNTQMTSVYYSVYFDATNTSSYDGGTLSNVRVELNTKRDGSGTIIAQRTLSSSLYVAKGSSSSTYTGNLTNNSGSSLVYFLVRFDSAVQFGTVPLASIT